MPSVHVVDRGSAWSVEYPRAAEAISRHATLRAAIVAARQCAQRRGDEEVVVHERDGATRRVPASPEVSRRVDAVRRLQRLDRDIHGPFGTGR